MEVATEQLTGLSVADLRGPITTFDQLGGGGTVLNKALAIPVHLGGAWNSIEYVLVPPVTGGVSSSVGAHIQGTDEIYFIHRGSGVLVTNDAPGPVAAGALVVAPKGTRHSIRNESAVEPLGFLVIELKVPPGAPAQPPLTIPSLAALLAETPGGFHPALSGQRRVPLRVAEVWLRDYFAAPWGGLSLVEIPAGCRVEAYREELCDENLFVVSGNATIVVAGERFTTEEHGLNVLIPRGVSRSIRNESSVSPLTILSVRVRSEGDRVAS
jgi:mannose-6-phosphate isomerase-like protein (cupin superfamily)